MLECYDEYIDRNPPENGPSPDVVAELLERITITGKPRPPVVSCIREARQSGIPAIPIKPGTKAPGDFIDGRWTGLKAWQSYIDDEKAEARLAEWEANASEGYPGVGILTGNVAAIDLDIEHDALALDTYKAALEICGPTPYVRIGRFPKRLLVYRTAEAARIQYSAAYTVDGHKCRIEILGKGQQFVAEGIHPGTGEPYWWEPYIPCTSAGETLDPHADDFTAKALKGGRLLRDGLQALPIVERSQIDALLRYFESTAELVYSGEQTAKANEGGETTASGDPIGDYAALAAALPHLPDTLADDYSECVRVGQALKRALPDRTGEAFELWDAFCARSAKYEPEWSAEKWETFTTDDRESTVGAGTVYYLAGQYGWDRRADATADFADDPLPPDDDSPQAKVSAPVPRVLMLGEINPDLSSPVLVKGLLPAVGVAHIYGKFGSRKSQIAVDLGLAIASGASWCGRRTQKGAVLFSAAEGPDGMRRRLKALRDVRRLPDDLPFGLRSGGFALTDPRARKSFIDDAQGIAARTGAPLKTVFLDTLTAHSGGVDINDPGGMAKMTLALREISTLLQCLVLTVHHPGKEQTRGMRGAQVLADDADAVLLVNTPRDDRSVLTAEKLRDDDSVKVRHAFAARFHELGRDADGDPVTAPYVDPTDVAAEDDFEQINPPLAGQELAFVEALPQDGSMIDTRAHRETFKTEWQKEHPVTKPDSLDARWRAMLKDLERQGYITVEYEPGRRKRPAELCKVVRSDNN